MISQLVSQGVPQGSILGPVLFISFINDMPLHMPDPNVEIYDDDTTLARSVSIAKMPVLTQIVNQDLIRLEKWCNENGMIINTSKTKSMLIAGKRLRNYISTTSTSIDVNLNDTII